MNLPINFIPAPTEPLNTYTTSLWALLRGIFLCMTMTTIVVEIDKKRTRNFDLEWQRQQQQQC